MARPRNNRVTYSGPLASVLTGFVAEKQATGYRYRDSARHLLPFDRFVATVGHRELSLPRDLVLRWAAKRPHETESNRQHRISLIRLVGDYMQRCGYPAYVYPVRTDRRTPPEFAPYIFSRAEVARLLRCIDANPADEAAPRRRTCSVKWSLERSCVGAGMAEGE